SSNPDADLAYALTAVDRALLLAPHDYYALREKSRVLRAQGNWDAAAAVIRRLIELRPQVGFRYSDLGFILMVQGHPKEALENFATARRLALISDAVQFIDANIAIALLANDRFSEAVAQARLAIAQFPPESGRDAEFPWLALIAAEAANGQE